jgi:hypothetical protein
VHKPKKQRDGSGYGKADGNPYGGIQFWYP